MRPAFASAWRSELVKVTTVRGLWIAAVLSTAAIPLISLISAGTGGLGHDDTVTSAAAAGTIAGLLAFGTWGVSIAAGEHTHATIAVSLASVPRRGAFVGAKLAAGAAIAGSGALVSSVLALLIVRAVLPRGAHHYGNPAALLSIVLAVVAVTIVGTSIGLLTRSSTSGIVILFGALLLPGAAAGLLGGLQPWIVGASPSTVVTQAVGGAQLAHDQTFPPGTAAAMLTMVGIATLLAVISGITVTRRDA